VIGSSSHDSISVRFRFANKYSDNGREYRVLYKAYGLRFIVSVTANAGKFSILPLAMTVGAGIGLMSISVSEHGS
jgi:P2X purinoceptor 4